MTKQKKSTFSPIAVVGASGLFPGSIDGQSFWRNILAGEDFMTEVPEDHWLIDDYYDARPATPGKIYSKRGAFLPKVDFDPMQFGIPPTQLSTTDTAQLLALIVASKVLDDAASVQFGKVDKADISVILGVASATELVGQMVARIQRPNWVKALRDAGIAESKVQQVCAGIEATYPEWDESTFPGLLGNVVAGRIANRLDLGGTNCVVDAACASSLGAVAMAVSELQSGHSNLVITGGVDALNDIFMYMCFSQTPALSVSGDCRPFAADADGTMLGEGIGMVALRRLQDAERDGDRIYAVIRGIGSSSDGRSGSIYAPESKGQALAIRRAYAMTDYDVNEVELIEAHGTATKAGDAAEFGGLRYAFEGVEPAAGKQWCALGSVKSQIGHTKSAAGAASLFKVVMALHHKVLPGTIKVGEPNPALKIEDSPFYINAHTRPWIHAPGSTRKGSVSSFGFGGSNFHVTLEEHAHSGAARGRYHSSPVELLLFSANTSDELIANANAVVEQLPGMALSTLAQRLQHAFAADNPHRLAIITKDTASAASQINQAMKKIGAQPSDCFSMPNQMHYGVAGTRQKLGFLFPGQGSQYVNMGAELACEFDQARTAWDIASSVQLDAARRLDQVVFPIPVFNAADKKRQHELLTQTEWAQPAIGAVSSSMLNLLDTLALKPDAVAGHSYGEVTALHAAGVIKTPEDLIAVSRRRGELMQAAAATTAGAMTAVSASHNEVQSYIDAWDCEVVVANINSPNQVVIAGETADIDKVEKQLAAVKLTFRRLPVATAFHTHVVSASAEPFHKFLCDLDVGKPRVPVYANTSAAVYSFNADEIRSNLAWQLAKPVRFEAMIQQMHADGIRIFLEVGPGATLAGMVQDCLTGSDFEVISLDHKKLDGRSAFWNAMGRLSAAGVTLNYAALWADYAAVAAPADAMQWSPITVKMGGANLGKPYPPENGSAGLPAPNPETVAPSPVEVTQAPAASSQTVVATTPTTSAPAQLQQPVRDANWVAAFESLQRQTLEAQQSFQSTLGEAHQAFLRASEVAFAQLGGNGPAVLPEAASPPAAVAQTETEFVAPPAAAPVPVAAPFAVATPVVAEPVTLDFEAMVLDIVAAKTGYPKEMLTLDMELESGLGIDSIKRVEILSSLQDQLPELGELDTAALAELNTLGEIIAFAGGSTSVAPTTPAEVAEDGVAAEPPAVDFDGLLLDVVAAKTGYPKEMLSLDMELESGLGIDSIKRVEILSALQEQLPQLVEMDAAALTELNTLREIAKFFSGSSTTSAFAGTVAAPAQTTASDMRRYEVVVEARRAAGIAIGQLHKAAPLYLVGDRSGVAEQLAELLENAGVATRVADKAPENAQWLVLLTGLNTAKQSIEELAALNVEAFQQTRQCAAAMAASGKLLVTVQATGGDFGVSGNAGELAWASGFSALAKTASREWPGVDVKAVDIATEGNSSAYIAQTLFAELVTGGPELEVGLSHNGARITLVSTAAHNSPASTIVPLTKDSVVVVSGGARGVTAACVGELLRRTPAKLAILGRTPLKDEAIDLAELKTDAELKQAILASYGRAGQQVTPLELNNEVADILNAREVRANLAQLEATGAKVLYVPTDIADQNSVTESVAKIRQSFGSITALIHAAGVLADKQIHKKTDTQFQSVFTTKVTGLRNLLAATESDPLTHLLCFSSVAARVGNNGQVDYAMANEILNRVCQAENTRRGAGFSARSIGWGPWAGGMVDPSLAGHFRAQGVELIPLDEGARFFADEFEGRNGDCVEIVYGGGINGQAIEARDQQMAIRVQRSTHPQIASHLIQGQPVVPMAMVNEWCLGIARALNPSESIASVRDLSVLKGIALAAFDTTGDWIIVNCDVNASADLLDMSLSDEHGHALYQLSVEIGSGNDRVTEPESAGPMDLGSWEWSPEEIYRDFLFHGEALQVVNKLLGVSQHGCRGILQMPTGLDLEHWRVALLDGGLQLALLWERHRSGRAALPTSVGHLQWRQAEESEGVVECELILQKSTQLTATWSIVFTNAEKQIIATMKNVDVHVLLDKAAA